MAHQGTERPGAHFDYAGLIRFRFLKDLNHRWTLMDTDFTGGSRANGEQKRWGKEMEAKRF